ncbi:hypothetical protein BN2476_320104 [Paraburkholderia piptadeniae]|uniref:Uncharacterized protein n=1 Tax=Paraburkholderia piptadeniae TaxID=1701573 RepID=A0A1N7S529_9BURK|nr:hypothetical protein BN2476_320104 [Paraburkholderia piptadeniae]
MLAPCPLRGFASSFVSPVPPCSPPRDAAAFDCIGLHAVSSCCIDLRVITVRGSRGECKSHSNAMSPARHRAAASRSNAVGPVTRRAPPSSGCTAAPCMGVTFGRQNCAGNPGRCDTRIHAAHIVGIFGAGTIGQAQPCRSGLHWRTHAEAVSGQSCGSDYLSYRSPAQMNNVSTMDVTALASIRRRVCSH